MIDADVRDQLFISYSHLDEQWPKDFTLMLAHLERAESLTCWCDKDIKAGGNWKEKNRESNLPCRIALLLVSDAFLASDFIQKGKIAKILRDHTEFGLRNRTNRLAGG